MAGVDHGPEQPKVTGNENQTGYSGLSKSVLIGLGVTFVVVAIFSLGVFVGEQKARFSYKWSRNYHREFGGPPMGLGRPRAFFGGHGAGGTVIDKQPGRLRIIGPDNAEKLVLVGKNTRLLSGRQEIKQKSIKEGSKVLVIGSPDDKGRIKARLIRVFDPKSWKESMWREKSKRPLPPSFL